MKQQVRIMGVDDSKFSFSDESTLVAAVVVRAPAYIESVLSTHVAVDGTDSTEKLSELIGRSRHSVQLKAVFIDGAAMGGFNVIDFRKLYNDHKIPLISVTRDKPDLDSVKKALSLRFSDWETRWDLISDGELLEIETKHNPIFIKAVGISRETAVELINLTTVQGALPEPLRLAHLIASGVVMGESTSKA